MCSHWIGIKPSNIGRCGARPIAKAEAELRGGVVGEVQRDGGEWGRGRDGGDSALRVLRPLRINSRRHLEELRCRCHA